MDVEGPCRPTADFEKDGRERRARTMSNKILSKKQSEEILKALQARFENNANRHRNLDWAAVQAKLEAAEKLWSLYEMEKTGGEPDVVGQDKKTGEFIFCDCSPESPKDRRSLCYDREALNARKANKPKGSAMDMAAAMGIALLTEDQYRELQTLGNSDTKTSSWVQTPPAIRELGGALFCDLRYNLQWVFPPTTRRALQADTANIALNRFVMRHLPPLHRDLPPQPRTRPYRAAKSPCAAGLD